MRIDIACDFGYETYIYINGNKNDFIIIKEEDRDDLLNSQDIITKYLYGNTIIHHSVQFRTDLIYQRCQKLENTYMFKHWSFLTDNSNDVDLWCLQKSCFSVEHEIRKNNTNSKKYSSENPNQFNLDFASSGKKKHNKQNSLQLFVYNYYKLLHLGKYLSYKYL